ncbi:hypothetical protein Vadar_020715 [Vaccinium darrowii]|uniref:Uncharacterized protein n=1 Tax=Vaccinium darrowii TaxID=229202 RepID=A0ACB7YN82_9ERIC|nr:hypothetical protein Vadar_020715 [Vaccinium darrowii]
MAELEILDLEEGTGDSGVNNSKCLVGKVFQGKNLRASILSDILKVAWRTRAPFYVDEWNNNVFLFRFENEEDRSSIIREGPWSVMNNLLVLIPLMDGMVVSELNFTACPFWVQIHGLPVEKLSRKNAEIIGNQADSDGLCLSRGFLRVRVEINIEQPLPKGFWLRGRADSTRDRWIAFKYEKLPDFCYACGRIGHDNRGCRFVSSAEGEDSGYGPEMRTGRARRGPIPIEIIRAEVDAAEQRIQNLVAQRPEVQFQARGERVINRRVDEKVHNDSTMAHQNHEIVEVHFSSESTSTGGTRGTGGNVQRHTGFSLSSIQEPDSPKCYSSPTSPETVSSTSPLSLPLAQPTLSYDNPSNIQTPTISQLQQAQDPPSIESLSNTQTQEDIPPPTSQPKPDSEPTQPSRLNFPNINHAQSHEQNKPNPPLPTDISISNVFKSLSIKRKLGDDEDPSPTRSKILRICSNPCDAGTFSPNANSSLQLEKPKKAALRAKSTYKRSTVTRAQLFEEKGLCDVQVQQWFHTTGESIMPHSFNLEAEMNGRVAGPEQPHSSC